MAQDLIVLDLRPSNAFTDYFVICSGRTNRQVTAIADAVTARLKAVGCRPSHVEGYRGADWILIDCFDFIVHVFTPEALDFYALERLFGEADRVDLADPSSSDQGQGDLVVKQVKAKKAVTTAKVTVKKTVTKATAKIATKKAVAKTSVKVAAQKTVTKVTAKAAAKKTVQKTATGNDVKKR
jgi:ribosome-associated protein